MNCSNPFLSLLQNVVAYLVTQSLRNEKILSCISIAEKEDGKPPKDCCRTLIKRANSGGRSPEFVFSFQHLLAV